MIDRLDTSGNQSFDRSLRSLYRQMDGLPEPLDEDWQARYVQTLVENADFRAAIRAAFRESEVTR